MIGVILVSNLFYDYNREWGSVMQISLRYIDLFCGIGGFRQAAKQLFAEQNIHSECVFSSDIDENCRKQYFKNYKDMPHGDITKINALSIPDHEILFAGFPCQPFSIIGMGKGFEDTRGTLFFEIARILQAKRPKAFILENVKQLVGHRNGTTIKKIISALENLGYTVEYKVLNALDYGLPQKRERVFIVGFHKDMVFEWPMKSKQYKPLSEILESNVDKKHFASERIYKKRLEIHKSKHYPAIWHENKAGNISSYPYSCALRAGASYNYLLVNGERRFTPREMLRLQGFPDDFEIVVPDSQIRKQAGNAVPVNLVKAVLKSFLPIIIEDCMTSDPQRMII